jgi:hypothetical protein
MGRKHLAALLRDDDAVLEAATTDARIVKPWLDRDRVARGKWMWIA